MDRNSHHEGAYAIVAPDVRSARPPKATRLARSLLPFPVAASAKSTSFWRRLASAVRAGVGGSFFAAPVLVALLAGCGGGGARAPTRRTHEHSSAASSANSATAGTTTPRPSAAAYWPYEKVVTRLAGRTLVLSRGRLRLEGSLLVCNGDGAPRRTGATRRWRRYTCTQTLFAGGADHDVTFDVVISSATQLRIISPRYGPR